MRAIVHTNYTFDASAKTVTIADENLYPFDGVVYLNRFLSIVNVTDNIVIYDPVNPAKGGSLSGNVLTLDFDTSSMSDTDDLMVVYEGRNNRITNDGLGEIVIRDLAGQNPFDANGQTGINNLPIDYAKESTLGNIDTTTTTLGSNSTTMLESYQEEDAAYTAAQRLGVIAGVRRDADGSPVSDDGDVHPFVFNSLGRLKVSTLPSALTAVTGSITANGQTVEIDTTRSSNVMFYCTGTFSTVNVTFEGSIDGGANWFAVQAVRSNANTIATSTGNLSAAPAYAWEASVNGLTNFRVRATAFTSGSQDWTILPGIYATEPIPAAQVSATQPISGTVTANLGTGGTGATSLGKAEDAVAANGDTGVAILAVRRDTPSTDVSNAGDYATTQVNRDGLLWTAGGAAPTGGWLPATGSIGATKTDIGTANTAGQVGGWYIYNPNTSVVYVQFFNAQASAVTLGTTAPVYSLAIPAGSAANVFGIGIPHSTAISIAVTTTRAGSTGPASTVDYNIFFKQ